jgi:hypothetical protein
VVSKLRDTFLKAFLRPFGSVSSLFYFYPAWHHMGKKSRTPSVETRVVETKQRFSGSLENILFTLFTFCLLCFHFSFFCSSSSSFVGFHFYFIPNLSSFGVRLFLARGCLVLPSEVLRDKP